MGAGEIGRMADNSSSGASPLNRVSINHSAFRTLSIPGPNEASNEAPKTIATARSAGVIQT